MGVPMAVNLQNGGNKLFVNDKKAPPAALKMCIRDRSNNGNRMRLAEDRLVGPYLDNLGLFSIENGGGAHFHVAMLANMTYPFREAREWNSFAPKTLKQLLIRSTNVLGYSCLLYTSRCV